MSIEDVKTVERLEKMVSRLTSNLTLREDMMQEALVHLWLIQQQLPGQTESWYLQNCRFHLQHYLAAGRSVDSFKRSGGRVQPSENGDDHDTLLDIFDSEETCEAVLADVSARDIITAMSKWLPEVERTMLRYLAEGFGTCDIARRLNISHPMVIKHRRKIAALATKLAIASLSEFQRQRIQPVKPPNGAARAYGNRNAAPFTPPGPATRGRNGTRANESKAHLPALELVDSGAHNSSFRTDAVADCVVC